MGLFNRIGGWFLICALMLTGFCSAKEDTVVQILDNTNTDRVEVIGNWQTSTWTGGGEYFGENYIHDMNTEKGAKKVRFTPDLPAGNYDVCIRYTNGSNLADKVTVDIRHAGGTAEKQINQQQHGGAWMSLGSFEFAGDGSNYVEIKNNGGNEYVIADAVAFIQAPEGSPCLDKLVSYWDFDQQGIVILDQAGKNTGWIQGASEAPGVINTCLQFDGNDHVLVPDSENLRLVDSFTLCAWVKESAPAQYAKLISRRDGDYFYFGFLRRAFFLSWCRLALLPMVLTGPLFAIA